MQQKDPVELESQGPIPWTDRLILGQALSVLKGYPDSSFDLMYLDPPFFSGSKRRGGASAAKRWNTNAADKQSLGQGENTKGCKEDCLAAATDDCDLSFNDVWPSLQDYLDWLIAHLEQCHRLLKESGSIFLHLDSHAVHYAKVEMDTIFGREAFLNEIIWWYRSGGGTKRRFGRKHDNLLYYARVPGQHTFIADEARVPYDAAIAPKRRHLFNPKGKIMPDVWNINRPPNHAPEWNGYPTQKPIALMERIIRCTTKEGEIVCDPFCGSGTTAVTAHRLNRRFVAIDVSKDALLLAQRRLATEAGPIPVEIENMT